MGIVRFRFLFLAFILTTMSFESSAFFRPKKVDKGKGLDLINKKKCDLRISFGSYGSGIPTKVRRKIIKILNDSDALDMVYVWHHGKEGEHDYCILTKTPAHIKPLFNSLKKVIPEYSKEGYTILVGEKNGLKWKTNWPPQ